MAAELILQVLVSPLLGNVFDSLSSLIRSEFGLVMGVNRELERLSNTLSTIRDVLEDAELKQIADKPIRNWLKKLKDVAYDAEDILDECATEGVKTKGLNNIHEVFTDSMLSCFDFKRLLSHRHTIGKRIRILRERFDEIAEERLKFHLNLHCLNRGDVESRQTSSFPAESHVYGRDEDKDYIVNLLLNNMMVGCDHDVNCEGPADVSVCVILGMGGLGKTTLAQMVHHDDRIVKHFEVRCWICVSENFEPKALLKALIESSGGVAHDLENLDPLQQRLQERLRGKRFLVVLDDVWNADQAKWGKLKSSLRCGGVGSSIIVTTRLEKVASISATLPICRPKLLLEKDCWSLFKHRAFDLDNNKDNHPNLEVIGKEIVKKCGGVPLAAKALGGLLRFKREEKEWLFVRDSEIWDLPQDAEDAILPALRLSYNHLPSHLRQCFAYCSVFPKYCVMGKEELIHLWIANGFVQPRGGSMELEDVGNEIFNDLLWRSFFQDFEMDEDNNIVGCKMHDLVHDLACSIMGDECSVLEVGKTANVGKNRTNTRHLTLVLGFSSSSASSTILESSLPKSKLHLRTLLRFNGLYMKQASPILTFSDFICLRVLDLSQTDMRTMPISIGNLKHLRYLNLSYSGITSLPNESFCSLKNLQTLILYRCRNLQKLPEDLRKMNNLRHLDIRGCNYLAQMPIGMGKLICLRTLSTFIVGPESGCGIEELQGLDHLKGELVIKSMEYVRNSTDARNANLMRKRNLSSLRLFWSGASRLQTSDDISEKEEEVLVMVGEGLQPHPNIKKLHIEGYEVATFPSWMGASSCLPNLVSISLLGCTRCESLPSLGELPFLQYLKVSGLNSVKYIGHEFYYGDLRYDRHGSFFPSLKHLEILCMPNLEEWSSPLSDNDDNRRRDGEDAQVVAFPCLKWLTIFRCPKLRRCPQLPLSLKSIHLVDNLMTSYPFN